MKRLTLLTTSMVLANSCANARSSTQADCSYEVRKVEVANFTSIQTSSAINVIYTTYDGPPQVEIHAPADLQPYIHVEVTADGTLTVGMKQHKEQQNTQQQKREVHVKARPVNTFQANSSGDIILQDDLSVRRPVKLITHSSGDIIAQAIRCTNLNIETASSGGVILRSAACENADCQANSSGKIIIKKLDCTNLKATANSSGDVHIDQLDCTEVVARASSSGDISLTGDCRAALLETSSSGKISASRLTATTVTAEASSTGTVVCHATESIEAKTSSRGEITYSGNPVFMDLEGERIRKQ